MNTRGKILDKALEMFNERGIEYVGLRELAGLLDMRVSNITYYFPTKDDLVYELSQALGKANSAVMTEAKASTLTAFLDMLHQVFQNHIRFRCLLLSVVHLMKQNRHLAAEYQKTQSQRNASMRASLQALEKEGYLKLEDEGDLEFLVSGISLISRFWISEAAISFQKKEEEMMNHYLLLITRLLRPYTTAMAKKQLLAFGN
jgi:AcrR family transcriptional regulator